MQPPQLRQLRFRFFLDLAKVEIAQFHALNYILFYFNRNIVKCRSFSANYLLLVIGG